MGLFGTKEKNYDTEIALLNEKQVELSQRADKNKSDIVSFGIDFGAFKTSVGNDMNEIWSYVKNLTSELAELRKWKEEQNKENIAIETAKTLLPDTLTYKEVCQSLKDFTYLTVTTFKYYLYECGIMDLKINPIHNTFRISESFDKTESELKKYIHTTDGAITFDKNILEYLTNNPKGLQNSIDKYIRKQKQFNESKEHLSEVEIKNFQAEICAICGTKESYDKEKWTLIYNRYEKDHPNYRKNYDAFADAYISEHPNMKYVISTIGYDPYEDVGLSDADRKYCYNILSGYCDTDGISEDGHKMQGVIEMTISNRNSVALKDMALAMSEAGTVASSYNVTVEDLSAMVGTIESVTKSGGSEVGNSIKSILVNLQNVTSDKITGTLDKANASMTEFVNGAEKLRNPIEILRDLAKTFNTLDEDDPLRAEIITNVAGKFQASKLAALLQNMELFDKMLVDYSEGSGSALEEANKSATNLTGSINTLQNSWNELINSLVTSENLKAGVNFLNGLVQGVTELTSSLGTLGTIGLGAGIFELIKNFGRLCNKSCLKIA